MTPDLERLVGRAILDKKFRKDLLDDPAAAVAAAGFQLSAEELAKLTDAVQSARKRRKNDDIDEQIDSLKSNW